VLVEVQGVGLGREVVQPCVLHSAMRFPTYAFDRKAFADACCPQIQQDFSGRTVLQSNTFGLRTGVM
jgi:hypothetical protein